MSDIRFGTIDTGEVVLGHAAAGDPDSPLLLCLHGFPEYWAGWKPILERLSDRFHVVAPDQRGYNRSSAPPEVEAYRARHLIVDVDAIADRFSPDRPFVLAGHDWGASAAYAYAFRRPERLSVLVIVNGVHPVCFQRAIIEDDVQRRASQYINRLREPESDTRMAEDGYARALKMIEKFSSTAWMTDADRAGYLDAWSRPGVMRGMLNWYRAAPIVVPEPGEMVAMPDWAVASADRFTVRVPHLVLWGEDDQALRPSTMEGLDAFAPDLEVVRIPGSGHWIIHEQPDRIADEMRRFLG